MWKALIALIMLVVLAILLIAADRALRRFAERKVAGRLAAACGLVGRPAVTLQGFPFLTQLVAGRYHEVHVVLSSVAQAGVQFQNLRARFSGVRAPLSGLVGVAPTTITATDATATALVPFGSLRQRLPAGLTLSAASGKLRLLGNLGYQGFQVPVSAGVSFRVTPDAIEFSPRDVCLGGAFSVPAGLLAMLAFALPMHDLPMRLKVTSVQVTEAGFELSALAQRVAFVTGANS